MLDNRGKVWLTEDYEQLTLAFASGVNLLAICESVGRTPSAVVAKLQMLGLLTNIGRNYHRVDPDPWVTWQAVVLADDSFKQSQSQQGA